MARQHKYIKRTGSPGNYKYWYKNAEGRVVEGDDDQQKLGKVDHTRRLLAGKAAGKNGMSKQEIAGETGLTPKRVQENISNMRASGRRKTGGSGPTHEGKDMLHHGHEFDELHLNEAHTHIRDPRYAALVAEKEARASAGGGSTARKKKSKTKKTKKKTTRRAALSTAEAEKIEANEIIERLRSRSILLGAAAPAAAAETPAPATAKKKRKKKTARAAAPAEPTRAGVTPLGRSNISDQLQTRMRGHQISVLAMNPLTERAVKLVEDENMSLNGAADKAFEEFKAAGEIRVSDVPPTPAAAPEVAELAEHDPAFGEGEEKIQKMVQDQAEGKNPYLDRAKEIYNRIKGDLNEERRDKAKHALSALDAVGSAADHHSSGSTVSHEAELIAKYKELSGRNRVTTFPWKELDSATFHSKEELLNNPSVDVPMERMKRGYAAKQFARSLPFLKDSWKSANAGAPPPMPTFGDYRSWNAGEKPAWAGNTRIAVPKEIFDASFKVDGKPKYPPPWMPIHMMPVWNYIAKSSDSNPYLLQKPTGNQLSPAGELALPSQARSGAELQEKGHEGHLINALRKYVQMRGGPGQMIDIPSHKLAEAGLTHADIFKAAELSDAQLKKLITTKVIDHVELLKIVKKISGKKEAKKSFFIEKSERNQPTHFEIRPKTYVVDLSKSERSEEFYIDARKI